MQMNRNEIRILSTLTAFAHKALWNVFICSLSLIRCLFKGPRLTLSPFVQSSPNVQVSPLIAFATLDHKQVSLAWKCFPFSLSLVLSKASLHYHHDHRGRKRQTVIIIIHGLYRPGSQIEGVVSTLQL